MRPAATLFLAGWMHGGSDWAWPVVSLDPEERGGRRSVGPPVCSVAVTSELVQVRMRQPTGGQGVFQGWSGAGDRSYPVVARANAWSAGEAGGWEGFVVAGESESGRSADLTDRGCRRAEDGERRCVCMSVRRRGRGGERREVENKAII
ncbi:hypothetical protein F5X68DRAFT_56919 [Plectosphaerella plurivora]|uniref:Uncharacterized protein n=1 Tax=Plectosphaerella plurivora TaxID=936078 RepID=A0A9P9AFN1_9PEZI|nr:hypothetical protein F5X68DRAFT_56919 [Plectosphaerella plurivora]